MSYLDPMAVAGGLEVEEEAGVGLWLTLGFVGMAHRCRRSLRRMAKGRVGSSKLMIRLIVWVGGDCGGCGDACASLTLRYHRIYSICACDASKSRFGTELTRDN